MITRRSVFKNPLCPNCSHYVRIKFQDDTVKTECSYFNKRLIETNLAVECTYYSDKLKDKYWELLNKQSMEIPIIGDKPIKAGFRVERDDK